MPFGNCFFLFINGRSLRFIERRFKTAIMGLGKKIGVRFHRGIYGCFETALVWLSKMVVRFLRFIYGRLETSIM